MKHQIFNRKTFLVGGSLAGLLSSALVSSAATLTASELSAMLKDPNLKLSASSTTVVGSGPAVTVLAEEDPKTTEQELKIDAVFVSKALIEAAPGQIESVKVLFSQSGRDGRFITIANKEIQDFGKGKITPDKLLASLRLTDVEPEKAPEVQPGTQFEKRLLVWRRIEKLRQQGTGVGPFETIFKEIEGSVKAGDSSKVTERVAYIESKLSDQEEQLKQARKTMHGHGVPASSLVPTATGTAATASQGGSGYVPPEADMLKKAYGEKAFELISQVDRKNKSDGDKLRTLKQQIDQRFAARQEAEGFHLLHQFGTLVQQALGGSDPFGPPEGGPGPGLQRNNTGGQTSRLWGETGGGTPGMGPGMGPGGGMGPGPGGRGPEGGGPPPPP